MTKLATSSTLTHSAPFITNVVTPLPNVAYINTNWPPLNLRETLRTQASTLYGNTQIHPQDNHTFCHQHTIPKTCPFFRRPDTASSLCPCQIPWIFPRPYYSRQISISLM